MSALEAMFALHVRACNLPEPAREHRFAAPRRWRFDFAWPEHKIAAECEGGTWAGGRHTRGSGFKADCEKYNTATLLGWRVLRFTSDMVTSGEAVQTMQQFFESP